MTDEKNLPQDPDEEDDNILELVGDDGQTVQFELLDVVPYKDHEYIVVVPTTGDEENDSQVEIYLIKPDEGEETESYVSIEDEETEMAVYKEFQERNKDIFDFED